MNTGVVLVFVISTNMCYVAVSLFDAALHKPCKQSKTLPKWDASNAVDGIIDYYQSCTHTMREDNPWWEVDLQGIYSVHSVLLRNRVILGHRLSNFTIYVRRDGARQGTKCAYHNGAIADKSYKVLPCDYLTSGRFVKITKETKRLTLCEVQVLVIERSGLLFQQTTRIIKGEHEREMACSRPLTCAVFCQRSPSCLAFGYKGRTGTCRLHSSTHTYLGTNDELSFYVTLA